MSRKNARLKPSVIAQHAGNMGIVQPIRPGKDEREWPGHTYEPKVPATTLDHTMRGLAEAKRARRRVRNKRVETKA